MNRWEIKSSVFTKLLLVELCVVIGLFLIMNIILTWFFRDFFYRSQEKLLWKTVAQVQEIATRTPLNEKSENDWALHLSIIDRSSGVHLAVLQGHTLVMSTNDRISDITSNPGFLDRMFFLVGQQKTATLSVPKGSYLSLLIAAAPLSSESPYRLIAYSEVSNAELLLKEILRFVWLASLLILVLATPIVYLVSRNFTQPLAEMQRITKFYAKGDFSRRLSAQRHDEMGMLAGVLNEMAGQLEQIEQNRRNFLSNVSHELRTPLTSIKGFVQGMLDGTIAEADHKHYLSRVYRETQRMVRIVSDLLDMARMRDGQMDFQWETLNLWELCQEAGESMMPLAAEKGVNLSLAFPAEPAWIRGDYARLVQVLVNILDNALKYTSEGQVELGGRIEGGAALVTVADTGPGIPQHEIPYIFERFYRGGSGRGTGLGLAICKLIVDAHKGTVSASSRSEGGAVFVIQIPLTLNPPV